MRIEIRFEILNILHSIQISRHCSKSNQSRFLSILESNEFRLFISHHKIHVWDPNGQDFFLFGCYLRVIQMKIFLFYDYW